MKDGFKGRTAIVLGSRAESVSVASWLLDRGAQVTMTDGGGLRRVQGHLRAVAPDGASYESAKKRLTSVTESDDIAGLLPTVDVVVSTGSSPIVEQAHARGILVVNQRELMKLTSLPARQHILHESSKLIVIDDTGAISPERAIISLRQWGAPNCILIAGGDGKGKYDAWADEVIKQLRLTNVILLAGSATDAMRKALGPRGIRTYDSLDRCWQVAHKRSGLFISSVILFSPAAQYAGREFSSLVKGDT